MALTADGCAGSRFHVRRSSARLEDPYRTNRDGTDARADAGATIGVMVAAAQTYTAEIDHDAALVRLGVAPGSRGRIAPAAGD